MTAQEMIEAMIADAKLKPVEERALVLWFGLRGEPQRKLNERVELFKKDPHVTVKHVTRDWLRNKEANAIGKMRSAKERLKISTDELIETCKEEPYHSPCNIMIGLVD